MPKLTPVRWEKFEQFLLYVGCVLKRRDGSHRMYAKDGIPRSVVIQARGHVPVFIILNSLRTLGISRKEYLQVLEHL